MKLTGARRRALAVLDHGDRQGRTVRVSNTTTAPDYITITSALTVYWQSAEWLIAKDHARIDGDVLTLTDTGPPARQEAVA